MSEIVQWALGTTHVVKICSIGYGNVPQPCRFFALAWFHVGQFGESYGDAGRVNRHRLLMPSYDVSQSHGKHSASRHTNQAESHRNPTRCN